MSAWLDDGHCFGCGAHSEAGLKMRFTLRPAGGVESVVTIPAWLQGWRGIAHGGIISTILDEAMAHALGAEGFLGVTAEITVRYRRPVPTAVALTVTSQVAERRRNLAALEAEVRDDNGDLLASAKARFVVQREIPRGVRFGGFVNGEGA